MKKHDLKPIFGGMAYLTKDKENKEPTGYKITHAQHLKLNGHHIVSYQLEGIEAPVLSSQIFFITTQQGVHYPNGLLLAEKKRK